MKIITVHGTFSKSKDEGNLNWWELESNFQHEIFKQLKIKSESFIPFIWGPQNDQIVRESGGKKLFAELEKLQDEGVEFTIISHSHGGQVCYEAFLEATKKGKPLGQLKKWISVGSPFLDIQHSRFVDRVGNFHIISALLLFFYSIIFFVFSIQHYQQGVPFTDWLLRMIAALACLLGIAWIFLRATKQPLSDASKRSVANQFQSKSTFISHPGDEAIFALKSAAKYQFPRQNQSFFRKTLPVIFVSAVFLFSIFLVLSSAIKNENITNEINKNNHLLVETINEHLITIDANDILSSPKSSESINVSKIVLDLSIIIAAISAGIFLTMYLLGTVLDKISRTFTSKMLTNGIRAKVWGTDTGPRRVTSISTTPPYFDVTQSKCIELSDSIQNEMETNCNKKLAESSKSVRRLIAQIGLGQVTLATAVGDFFKDVDLKELIHTSYFDNKKVVELILAEIKA